MGSTLDTNHLEVRCQLSISPSLLRSFESRAFTSSLRSDSFAQLSRVSVYRPLYQYLAFEVRIGWIGLS